MVVLSDDSVDFFPALAVLDVFGQIVTMVCVAQSFGPSFVLTVDKIALAIFVLTTPDNLAMNSELFIVSCAIPASLVRPIAPRDETFVTVLFLWCESPVPLQLLVMSRTVTLGSCELVAAVGGTCATGPHFGSLLVHLGDFEDCNAGLPGHFLPVLLSERLDVCDRP